MNSAPSPHMRLLEVSQFQLLRLEPGRTSAATVLHRHEEPMLAGPDWDETYRREIRPAKLEIALDDQSRRALSKDVLILAQTASALFKKPVRLGAHRGSRCRN